MMTDEEIDKGLLILRVIWCAMLASLAIYVFVRAAGRSKHAGLAEPGHA